MTEEDAPTLDTSFSNYVLLCDLPIVTEDKKAKLLLVLKNIFKKKGIEYITEDNITVLLDEETEKSYGTAFIQCKTEREAKLAVNAIHNFALGKVNKIQASTFDEFDRLMTVPDEYEAPKFVDLNDLLRYFQIFLINIFI